MTGPRGDRPALLAIIEDLQNRVTELEDARGVSRPPAAKVHFWAPGANHNPGAACGFGWNRRQDPAGRVSEDPADVTCGACKRGRVWLSWQVMACVCLSRGPWAKFDDGRCKHCGLQESA